MTSGGPLVDAGKWLKKLFLIFVPLFALVPVISLIGGKIGKPGRENPAGSFPQAVCAGWENVSYDKAFEKPIAIEALSECHKNIVIPSAYHVRIVGCAYIRFFDEDEPEFYCENQELPYFGTKGRRLVPGKSGEIYKYVAQMSVAGAGGKKGEVIISPLAPAEKKAVEVTPDMTKYTGKNP